MADSRSKALRDLEKLSEGLNVMSGLLTPRRLSLEEKVLGLVAYDRWRERARG